MMQKQIAFSSHGDLCSNLSPRLVIRGVILVLDDGHSGAHSPVAAYDHGKWTSTVPCVAEVGCLVGSVC